MYYSVFGKTTFICENTCFSKAYFKFFIAATVHNFCDIILDFKGTCFSRLFPFLLVLKKVEFVFDLISIPNSSDELVAQNQTNSLVDYVKSRPVD
jgi:hypothetical protein